MLFEISRSDPWYADIVNFMVIGYVPPGGDKIKLIYKSRVHIWDCPYQLKKESKSLNVVTYHPMEDTMGHSEHMQRFGRVDSFGQPCMKT
jgi:hypothetical protein